MFALILLAVLALPPAAGAQTDFPPPKIEDERAETALCRMYAGYEVKVPDGYDAEEEAAELAEMFANGAGVPRDFAAALHLLCADTANMADAERRSMLEHVLKMERGLTDEPLDFCAHATSTYGGLVCAGRRESEERPRLAERYEAIRRSSGPALDALRAKADAFLDADAHWENETMRGGTIYSYIGTHTALDRETRFIELLEQYSRERAPAASAADLARADADLNAAYRKSITGAEEEERTNLRAAQRAWIPYRDAWIAYYQQRWRGAAPAGALRREIATRLTRERIADLTGD